MTDNYVWIGLAIAGACAVIAAMWYFGAFNHQSKAEVQGLVPDHAMTMPMNPTA